MTLPEDWASALAAQEVPEAEISAAQALARRQAEAARQVPHDPLGVADPAAYQAFLQGGGQ